MTPDLGQQDQIRRALLALKVAMGDKHAALFVQVEAFLRRAGVLTP